MFNPHIHHHQQQQQFQQHLRQIQQLFQHQVQPPPPPPPQPSVHHVPHPHQAPRAMPVPPQSAPPPRMVNLCQTTQTTIIAPNPMLQGALLMQQMQGNMRGFGMAGQQFRQFFAAGARSSLLGPVPMGVAIKSPMMGFPPGRPVYPHVRYYSNNSVPGSSAASASTTDAASARQSERKRDAEHITQDTSEDQPGPSTANEANEADNIVNPNDGDGCCTLSEEQLEEPEMKKQKTHGLEGSTEQPVVCVEADAVVLCSDDDSQPEECGSIVGSEILEENEGTEVQGSLSLPEDQQVEMPSVEEAQEEDCLVPVETQDEENMEDGPNKFYCYLCSITCLNQQNFRSHMNSISHQQRMMEIQHMSNACLVTLLPRLQDSLQGTKDGEKKNELKRWCTTCRAHFSSSSMHHRQTKEHKLARKMAISYCTVCKKRFRSSQIFIQHLQTLAHRKKVEMDNQGCEELSKIPDGFMVEEESGGSEDDETLSNAENQEDLEEQDGGVSKEVTLEDMDDNVAYDPKMVYGSSFFVPVAGFICRLCNKFYHFESLNLHSHCKSLEHFENLKRYKTDQDCAATRRCVAERELNTDVSTPATESSSKQPFVSLHRLQKQTELRQPEKGVEPNEAIQGFTISATHTSCSNVEGSSVEETTTSLTTEDQDSTTSEPAVIRDSAQSVSYEGNIEEKGIKNNSKTVVTPRRRTVRATNRR